MKRTFLIFLLMFTSCGEKQNGSTETSWQAPALSILRSNKGLLETVQDKSLQLNDIFRFESDRSFKLTSNTFCGTETSSQEFSEINEVKVYQILPRGTIERIGSSEAVCSFEFTLSSGTEKKVFKVTERSVSLEVNLDVVLNSTPILHRVQDQNLNIFNIEITNPYPVTLKLGVSSSLGSFNFQMITFSEKCECYWFLDHKLYPPPIKVTIMDTDFKIYQLNSHTVVEVPPEKTLHISYSVTLRLPMEILNSLKWNSYQSAAGIDYSYSKANLTSELVYLLNEFENEIKIEKVFGSDVPGLKTKAYKRMPYFLPFADNGYLYLSLDQALEAKTVPWSLHL